MGVQCGHVEVAPRRGQEGARTGGEATHRSQGRPVARRADVATGHRVDFARHDRAGHVEAMQHADEGHGEVFGQVPQVPRPAAPPTTGSSRSCTGAASAASQARARRTSRPGPSSAAPLPCRRRPRVPRPRGVRRVNRSVYIPESLPALARTEDGGGEDGGSQAEDGGSADWERADGPTLLDPVDVARAFRGGLCDVVMDMAQEFAQTAHVAHRTMDELRPRRHHPAGPSDHGTVALVVRRPDKRQREVLDEGHFDEADGLAGDTWRLRQSTPQPDGAPHPGMQLTLMGMRAIGASARTRPAGHWPATSCSWIST